MSYDNTVALGASTWRHVAFIEQNREQISAARESGRALTDLGMPALPAPAGSRRRPTPRRGSVMCRGSPVYGLMSVHRIPPSSGG